MARPVAAKWHTLRFEVLKRDNFTCQYCGQYAPNVILHVDHIIAVAEGGNDDVMNLITSCAACNRGKEGLRVRIALREHGRFHKGNPDAPERFYLGEKTVSERILEVLKEAELNGKELLERLDIKKAACYVALSRLRQRGLIVGGNGGKWKLVAGTGVNRE